MGYRTYQRILVCDVCGRQPDDGEPMWHMGSEVWCEACCDAADNAVDNEVEGRTHEQVTANRSK